SCLPMAAWQPRDSLANATVFLRSERKERSVAQLPLGQLGVLSGCNETALERLNTLRKKGRSGAITTTYQKEVGPGIRRERKSACISRPLRTGALCLTLEKLA